MSSDNKINLNDLRELLKEQKGEQQALRAKSSRRVNVNPRLVVMIFVYLSSLFVTALKELISSDMDWKYLGTSEFLSNMLFSTVNNIFLLLAVFVYFLDKYKREVIAVKEFIVAIRTNVKKFVSSIFSLFMKNFNRERRKNKFKAVLEVRLSHLEKAAKDADLLCWLRGTPEEKKENSYCCKKQDLLNRMDNDFIEEHIDETYVAIKETTSNFVKYGYTRSTENYRDPWDIENGFTKFLRDLGPKMLLGVVFIFILQAIRVELKVDVAWQEAIFAVILRLYPMAVHTYIGIVYARQYLDEKILVDLGLRLDISEQALEYQKNFLEGKITVQTRNTVEHPLIIYKGAEANG